MFDIWHNEIKVDNLAFELRDGVLLSRILCYISPKLEHEFDKINTRAVAKNACLKNIELSLSIIGRQGMPRRYIVDAEDIHNEKS